MGIKMFNCYLLTFNFSNFFTITKISNGITHLFYPLKLFKIDISKIELIISISLCMIPSLINEINEFKKTLKIKGVKPKFKNYLQIIKAQLILLLRKIDLIEKNIILKGYQED